MAPSQRATCSPRMIQISMPRVLIFLPVSRSVYLFSHCTPKTLPFSVRNVFSHT